MGVVWAGGMGEAFQPKGATFLLDFMSVYAAGETVHEGSPVKAYDWKGQGERERRIELLYGEKARQRLGDPNVPYDGIPWLYPPMFLSVAWLVSFLPFFPAAAAYGAGGVLLLGVVLYKLMPRRKESLWALAAFPSLYVNLLSGQNGALTTTLLGAGLYLLSKRPLAAGGVFGLLSYKPHLFVLVPLVLFVGRQWKALGAAVASAGLCAALSLAVFGIEPWIEFVRGLGAARAFYLENDGMCKWLGILHSAFSMVRIYGGSIEAAYAVQGIVSVAVVWVVLEIWRHKGASLAVRGAALAVAALLASPYSFGYDQVILAIPIAMLAREGMEKGFMPYEKIMLFGLWLLPMFVNDAWPGAASYPLTPPLLAAFLVLCWRRMRVETASTYMRESSLRRK